MRYIAVIIILSSIGFKNVIDTYVFFKLLGKWQCENKSELQMIYYVLIYRLLLFHIDDSFVTLIIEKLITCVRQRALYAQTIGFPYKLLYLSFLIMKQQVPIK